MHYHFVRENFIVEEINLIYVSTKNHVVDIFTSALRINKLRKFFKMFGILEVNLNLSGSVENSRLTSYVFIS